MPKIKDNIKEKFITCEQYAVDMDNMWQFINELKDRLEEISARAEKVADRLGM